MADAPVPAASLAYGDYGRMIEALKREGPAEGPPAVPAVLEHIADLLRDGTEGLPPWSGGLGYSLARVVSETARACPAVRMVNYYG